MRGYNRENFLKRVIEMKKHFEANYVKGQTIEYAYNTYIKSTFHISKKTFEKWMKLPAETELKKLYDDRQNKSQVEQITIEFTEKSV